MSSTAHSRIDPAYKTLRQSGDLRATQKKAGKRSITAAELDPDLVVIIKKRKVRDGKILPERCPLDCGKLDCDHAQTRAWLALRDAYAEKNRDLARRAAALQAKRNAHLAEEWVPCCKLASDKAHHRPCGKHGGKVHCAWCHGKGKRVCQPDLEALAYIGLLDAIRRFDPEKAGKISSYAVWLMKQSMMGLLRQTPVTFPQDLLRDRRELAKLEKQLERVATDEEAAARFTTYRPCKKDERMSERIALARNCYYGQEKKSVEDLQARYTERTKKHEKRLRHGDAGKTVVEALTAPATPLRERRALHEALGQLSGSLKADAEAFLGGKLAKPSAALVLRLRDILDVRMPGVLNVLKTV